MLLGWMIDFRWLVSGLQWLCLIPGSALGFVTPANLGLYMGLFAILPLYNLWLTCFKNRYGSYVRRHKAGVLLLSLLLDVSQLSVLLAIAGGWNNPFRAVLLIYGVLGAAVLRGFTRQLFLMVVLGVAYFLKTSLRSTNSHAFPWGTAVAELSVELLVIAGLMLVMGSLVTCLLDRQQLSHEVRHREIRLDRLKSIGALSSGICHQLATPLNNIKLRVDRLSRYPLETSLDCQALQGDLASLRTSLAKSESAIKKLAEIQLDYRKFSTHTENLVALILENVEVWRKLKKLPPTSVRLVLPYEAFVRVPVGPLTQMMRDLLDNALDAGGAQETIELRLRHQASGWVVEIEDQGPGFSTKVLEYLGEPFNSEKISGSGLGLYHARLICQLLGGDLEVANLAGKGALVRCRFGRGIEIA